MPTQFHDIPGNRAAVAAPSRRDCGDEGARAAQLALTGLVSGATGLFIATAAFAPTPVAAAVICIPLVMLAASWAGITDWFSGLWE